jgi:hypothetical protein
MGVKKLSLDPLLDRRSLSFLGRTSRYERAGLPYVVVTDSAPQIKANPENLANISFKLAEAFRRVSAKG